MSRRVITKINVDEMLAAKQLELVLEPTDIVTALAKEYAQQCGVRLVPAANAPSGKASQPQSTATTQLAEPIEKLASDSHAAAAAGGAVTSEPELEPVPDHVAVRKAVIAAVGFEPAKLDEVISKVME